MKKIARDFSVRFDNKLLKIAVFGIAVLFILSSCGMFGTGNSPAEVHKHSFTLKSNGQLKCSGCSEHIDNNYLAIVDSNNNVQSYALLTGSNSSMGLTVSGNNITYTNTSGTGRSIVLYTTSNQSLTINAPNDDVTHFGAVKSVNIVAVADNSYHGKASVEEAITVAKGNIELEVSVPEVKVEATGSVSVNLGKDAKVESLSVETKEGTALQTVKVGGTGTVEKLEASTPIKVETKVEAVEVKSAEVSITLSGNAEVAEVKVDVTVEFSSSKKLEINIEGSAKVEGVTGVDSSALETTTEPGATTVHIHIWDEGQVTKEATCTTDGVLTYSCKTCSEKKTEVIKALGHNYGEPVWTWSADNSTATAKFTCANDSRHVETVNASVSPIVTLKPTCTEKGNTKYTATASFNGKEYKTEKNVEIAALGHDYAITYQWSEDYKCTATRVCNNDANHIETETVQGIYSEITAATCSTTGAGKYMATFTNSAFTQQIKNVDIAKTVHTFDQEVVDVKYLKSAATCTSKAVYYKSCSCGEASTTETFEYGPLGDHTYNAQGVCMVCGYKKPGDILTGVFTVDSDGKKVQFSKGNLWYNTSNNTWHFEDSQLNYQTIWNKDHVDKFYWSKSVSIAVATTYSDPGARNPDTFFAADNFSVNGYKKWGTLSQEEWTYLLYGRRTNVKGLGDDREESRFARVVINGVKGLLIFPDTMTWDKSTMGKSPTYINSTMYFDEAWSDARKYTLNEFAKQEEAGVVFLPCAGFRRGYSIENDSWSGNYWSATADSFQTTPTWALMWEFYLNDVYCFWEYRNYGCSVRLVTYVESDL